MGAEITMQDDHRRSGSLPGLPRSRYSGAFPDLDQDEYAALVESVRRDGLRDAIWTYRGEVLDGWHRLLACREAGVEPRFREYAEGSPAHFALAMQRARRSLDSSQAAAIADALAEDLAREAYQRAQEGRSKGGGDRKSAAYRSRQSADESDPGPHAISHRDPPSRGLGAGKPAEASVSRTGAAGPGLAEPRDPARDLASPGRGRRNHKRETQGRSDERAAKLAGTNRQYLREYRLIKDRDPELAEKVRNKEVDIPRAKRTIRERDAAEKRRAELEANQRASRQEPELHLADFRQVEVEPGSVAAIITDPPYGLEHLPLYGGLAEYASRVLRPGGVLLAMAGQSYLPEVLQLLGEHLTYYWTLDYRTPGANASMRQRRVLNGWKPVFVHVRGSYAGNRFVDYLTSAAPEKAHHIWGQNEAAFGELIERFTKTGDLVLDPFMGGGTTGAAAISMKRRFVGCEIDPEKFDEARQRLGIPDASGGDPLAPDSAAPEGAAS